MTAVERVAVTDRAAFLRRREYRALRVLALCGLVVLWELVTRTGWVSSLFLPSPLGVIGELADMARSKHDGATAVWATHLADKLRRQSDDLVVIEQQQGAKARVFHAVGDGSESVEQLRAQAAHLFPSGVFHAVLLSGRSADSA